MPSDYARVVATLWFTDTQGMQLGVMAPGWVHGCLGLHFLLNRRPLYRKLRYVLFAFALLIPVFSGLGFIAMARELSASTAAAAAVSDYLGPEHAAERAGAGAMAQRAAARIFRPHRRDLRRARGAQRARARPPPPGHDLVSRPHRARAARMVGAGSKPQLSSPARLDVRRARALLDLPGAGERGRKGLPARGPRRARGARPHRRAARRAPRLPAAPAGRPVGDPAGAHGAAELSPDRAAAQRRARGRRALLRLPQSRRARGRSHAAGPALRAHALYRGAEQRHPRGARHAELHRARQPVRAVRARARPGAGGAPGAAGGRRDRAGDGRAQRAAGPAVELQGDAGGQHPSRPRRGGRDRRIRPAGGDRHRRGGGRNQRTAQGRRRAWRGIRDLAGGLCGGRLDPPPGEEIMVASPTKAATIPVVLSAAAPALPAPAAPGLAPRAALQRLWGQ